MEDLIMKKLIMFLMVLAIGAPALAIMVDESPPDWGGVTPRATYVWHIDTEEYAEPSCINFDAYVQDPVIWWGEEDPCNPPFAKPVGTWTPDPCNGTFSFQKIVSMYVEAPQGVGTSLTIRIQAELQWPEPGKNEIFWHFPQVFSWDEEKGMEDADYRAEVPGTFEQVGETDVYVMEETFYPGRADMLGDGVPPPDEKAIIGIVCELEEQDPRYTMKGMIIDVIRHFGITPPTTGPGRVICDDSPVLPLLVDPNVMTVYEDADRVTRGDFDVKLARAPFSGNVTIVVDPNGGNGAWGEGQDEDKDIELLAGSGPDNKATLTFTPTTATDTNDIDLARSTCGVYNETTMTSCWNTPLTIVFDALDDTAPEPPDLIELTAISFTATHPTDPDFNGERIVEVVVEDNDQANILFTLTPREQNNPKYPILSGQTVQIWEQKRLNFYNQWRKIGVTLQVEPSGDPVVITMDVDLPVGLTNPNPPVTDPVLDPDGLDPNRLYFDSDDWNISQPIKIWGNDDDKPQVFEEDEDEYPESDGDENYTATLTFTVVDSGGDERYGKMVELINPDTGFPYDPPRYEWDGLVKTVDIDIEDNECGAFGILPGDIGNSDPCAVDDDGNPLPDCQVDIYDVIEMARRWLNCTDPQGTGCENL
jgi:hypothetical protein